ncbi:uncharacterized protein J4E87_008934 [Alternaria ethzedia]|uniref:uncharacterized protein n=1 Tax=Alternaria ethzedia TaxID=181014 RepID=UPI0020C472F2|nr:uncharacterized protein J4E87_008934 [Alternaria ethzedia]KAI4616199.1 hypothetical protein J4E87_008934 [Alternaria ethzedia]
MATPTSIAERPKRELKVLSLGMTRTGSASITQALEILGYQGVHHGIQAISSPIEWEFFSKACDAFYPSLPTYTGAPFTRADWDVIFGPYEAVTDMSSFFATQLIEAYPEAKLILVERDIDEWYDSMEAAIFSTTWGLRADLVINVLGPLYGLNGGKTIRKIMLGFYGVRNVHEMRRIAKDRYRKHYAEIRAAVPAERLLEFRLEDGWKPLCEFLEKEVPEEPFPVKNKRDEHVKRVRQKQDMFFRHVATRFAKKAIPSALGVGVLGLAVWKSRSGARWAEILSTFRETLARAW